MPVTHTVRYFEGNGGMPLKAVKNEFLSVEIEDIDLGERISGAGEGDSNSKMQKKTLFLFEKIIHIVNEGKRAIKSIKRRFSLFVLLFFLKKTQIQKK